jgi:hypothetical protein
MYGEDGWCRKCGVPLHAQTGDLVLQRKGLTPRGAWIPNWRHDVICVDQTLATKISERFQVSMRDVRFPRPGPEQVKQIDVPVTSLPWYDHDELATRASARNGTAGARCVLCGTWRWMPVVDLPTAHADVSWAGLPIVSSPEWFGVGAKCFREILVQRQLADLIVNSSPDDFATGVTTVVSVDA